MLGDKLLTEQWKKSPRSSTNGSCVEARIYEGNVQVRNSNNPDGPVVTFTPIEWNAFVPSVKDGEFDI